MILIHGNRQKGITLLEVLISIGILAIGLVSTLALMPVGASYLKKAGTDNRAAALIDNAVNTMVAAGLFKEDAIYWGEGAETRSDGEVERRGFPSNNPAGTRNQRVPETYTSSGIWAGRDDEPTLSGTVTRYDDDTTVDHDYVFVSATRTGQQSPLSQTLGPFRVSLAEVDSGDTNFSDGKEYQWTYKPPDNALDGPSSNFEIHDSQVDVNNAGDWREFWYDEWDFDVTHNGSELPDSAIDISPPLPLRQLPVNPSAYAHYLPRIQTRTAEGEAVLDFTLPNTANGNRSDSVSKRNQSQSAATLLRFSRANERGSRRDASNRVFFHHSSVFTVVGHLWRYQTGYRRGRYTKTWNLGNENAPSALPNVPINLVSGSGGLWVDRYGSPIRNLNRPLGVKEDSTDWFQTPVRFDETVVLDFSGTDDTILLNCLQPDGAYHFPVYFASPSTSISLLLPEPDGSSGEQYTYKMPEDGVLYVRVMMKDAPLYAAGQTVGGNDVEFTVNTSHPNHSLQSGRPHNPYLVNTLSTGSGFSSSLSPGNPEYSFDLKIFGNTRVAAYDPLMASHLDDIIHTAGYNHPLDEEQRFFAKFNQIDRYGNSRVLELPRLNWRGVAGGRSVTESLAIAERLCRPDDMLEVSLPADEDMPSEPMLDAGVRRRSVGNMSWMLTIQPATADSAPLESHWKSGNLIDVAVVGFDKRQMPLVTDSVMRGEAEFDVDWNPLTGLFETYVPVASGFDIDDLREMFRATGWLMVAPKRYSTSQKIDWVQIQTCEIEEQLASNGLPHRYELDILPVREPRAEACNNPPFPNVTKQPMIVHVSQGIVSVSRRTIQVESP